MILNLTQHEATPEQVTAGVVNLDDVTRKFLAELLTFKELPCKSDIQERANCIARIAEQRFFDVAPRDRKAMIGGAPFLMPYLETELKKLNIAPLYAFSQRVVEEVKLDNGEVRKTAVFKHLGFIEA